MFGDPLIANAMLDRLLHHSHIVSIVGPSYRMHMTGKWCACSAPSVYL
ncbi:MAG: hypothetical protein JTJ21_04050 [Holdemanella sp.]|nr:hypothetical protein [Holdemanella sp.]